MSLKRDCGVVGDVRVPKSPVELSDPCVCVFVPALLLITECVVVLRLITLSWTEVNSTACDVSRVNC